MMKTRPATSQHHVFKASGFPSQSGEILLKERSYPMGETRRKFDKDFRAGAVPASRHGRAHSRWRRDERQRS
jgi:hypothetical protein